MEQRLDKFHLIFKTKQNKMNIFSSQKIELLR